LLGWHAGAGGAPGGAHPPPPRSTVASRLASRPRPFALRCKIGCVCIGCGSPVRAAVGQRVRNRHDGTSRRVELPAYCDRYEVSGRLFSRPYAVCRRIIRLPDDTHNTLRSPNRRFLHHTLAFRDVRHIYSGRDRIRQDAFAASCGDIAASLFRGYAAQDHFLDSASNCCWR
jgi:hypothetical protein